MWRESARAFGLALGGLTLVAAYFAAMFRFDSSDEYHWALQLDAELGLAAAVSVALVGIPPVGRNTFQWRAVLLTAALLTWILVSGGLASHHHRQDVIRSAPY